MNSCEEKIEELLALQAICENEFQILDVPECEGVLKDGLEGLLCKDSTSFEGDISCQVLVSFELEHPLRVSYSSGGSEGSVFVKHLPPLCMRLTLPAAYPTLALPEVEVCATWIPQKRLEELRLKMLSETKELLGTPIVFEWIQWLKANAGACLGMEDGQLLLEGWEPPEGPSAGGDGEAGGPGPLLQLTRYSALKEAERFRTGVWRCGICFEDLPGSKCLRLPSCSHHFCLPCLRRLAQVNVRDGSLASLACPDCGEPLQVQVLRDLLSAEEFERWEQLSLSRTLDRMRDLVYCPRCGVGCIEDDGDHCAQCPKCLYVFCGLCLDGWHPGSECLNTEARISALRNQRGSAVDVVANAINELKSLKELRESSKQCPVCRMAISKNGGCNKMTCANCGTRFCWKCGREVSGYSHFSSEGCNLFDAQEIAEWNAMMNGHRRAAPLHRHQGDVLGLDLLGGQVSHCPQCGQANAKANNNNHMGCWACGSHYCYLCRKLIGGGPGGRNGGRHFSPKGCKQHTPN